MNDEEEGGGLGLAIPCVGFVVFLGIVSAIAVPNLIEARKYPGESGPIGALNTIGTAQSLFREADKEIDGNLDYGTLEELGRTQLIDSVLASGAKQGYLFEASYSAPTSEFLWFAIATPEYPGETGDRYFAANHEGLVYYTTLCAFSLNTIDCEMPPGAVVLGR